MGILDQYPLDSDRWRRYYAAQPVTCQHPDDANADALDCCRICGLPMLHLLEAHLIAAGRLPAPTSKEP
jgi:hypothetical protein